MRKFLIVILALFLFSCDIPPTTTTTTDITTTIESTTTSVESFLEIEMAWEYDDEDYIDGFELCVTEEEVEYCVIPVEIEKEERYYRIHHPIVEDLYLSLRAYSDRGNGRVRSEAIKLWCNTNAMECFPENFIAIKGFNFILWVNYVP